MNEKFKSILKTIFTSPILYNILCIIGFFGFMVSFDNGNSIGELLFAILGVGSYFVSNYFYYHPKY